MFHFNDAPYCPLVLSSAFVLLTTFPCRAAQVALEGSVNCTLCDSEIGEIENTLHSKCLRCTDGSYAVPAAYGLGGGLVQHAECIQCPSSGFACDGGTIKIERGTWYSVSKNPTVAVDIEIHACFNAEACVYPGPDAVNAHAFACDTDKGYFGPLCGACDRATSFTRSGRACAKCEPTSWTWIAIAAVALGLFAFVVYLTAFRSTSSRVGEYGGIIRRIAFSYIQVRVRAPLVGARLSTLTY